MKLSQIALPALTTLSLALTPACTDKPKVAAETEITKQDKLCDLAVDYTRLALAATYHISPAREPLENAIPEGSDSRKALDQTLVSTKELILSSEMLERNCDADATTHDDKKKIVAQLKGEVKEVSAMLGKKWY